MTSVRTNLAAKQPRELLITTHLLPQTPIPHISVVLPVWNGERFLADAVESILSEGLDSLELIVVDDGSTDSSALIAAGFARRDPRVSVLTIEHAGIASALNAGIAAARGRYIARMDSDDISMPSRLQKQFAYLEANPECVAVGCAIEFIDESGASIGARVFPAEHEAIADAFLNSLSAPLAHPTVMARREALLAVGGYRNDRVPSEDFDLWIRLSEYGRLANLPQALLRYRRHVATVGVREREGQLVMGARLVNEARTKRGLRPLRPRRITAGKNVRARYHFECARIALLVGPRLAAIRHARASIASDPLWPEAYAALAACMLPKRTLLFMLSMYARLR
jgi:glycosyltransferase involved in cell wall biosynthesis